MEAGNRPAGDGDEKGREHGAGSEKAVVHIGCPAGESGDVYIGPALDGRADDADNRCGNHEVEQEGAQVIAGLQEHPHGKNCGYDDIGADHPHPGVVCKGYRMPVKAQGDDADDVGGKGGLSNCAAVHLRRTEGGSDDGAEGCDDQNQGQVGEYQEEALCLLSHGIGNNFADGVTLVPKGSKQGAEVMNAAHEDASEENPEEDGHPAENGRLNRSVDGAGAGNRGEVVAHQDRSLGGNVVHVIFHFNSGSLLFLIDAPLLGQPAAVEDVSGSQAGDTDQ